MRISRKVKWRGRPEQMIRKTVVLSLLGSFALVGCAGIDVPNTEVGSPAPEYAAATLDGAPASLEHLRGTVVLLNSWATWCAPCREEIPALQALYERHRAEGLEVIGVSVDGAGEEESIRRFAGEFEMTYPIWHDPDDRFGFTFRTIGVPHTFLIDREGVIRWRKQGPLEISDPSLNAALTEALKMDAPS